MTNETLITLLDYLCNEARNSAHASFGLIALRPKLLTDPEWQACLENSRSSADRLLRTIDDIRELVVVEPPIWDAEEEFDLTLSVGETIELLNLASGDQASRLILRQPTAMVAGRQYRRAVEQVLMRVFDLVSKLGRRGEVHVSVVEAIRSGGARVEIIPANSNIALKVADWLNADPERVVFQESGDALHGLAAMVAGKRIRALGGSVEFSCDQGAPMKLVISLPWTTEAGWGQRPESLKQDESGLNILVAEDCDESFALTGLLLQKESVWRARDGLEALEMMKARRFDLVFMDIHMPGIDGYQTIRSMRDWETETGNARTPIVVLSSDDLDTQMRSAVRSGCSGFLRKPLVHHDLLDLLDRLKAARMPSA